MAMSMPPPPAGGFSLRVQLFSSNAHTLSDKPVRAFRVVTSPDVTIRDFCQEASRIHQINYGQPITIKKCQDDQEFDVTQSEIVGALFSNTSTIRVIEASASPGIRDSVPPDSALRFDPSLNTSRKRDREGSAQPNGTPFSGWKPNKRQRVSDLDPDQPIPSRETDFDAGGAVQQPRREIVPDSQGSSINHGNGDSRDVRASIPETPPPESPPNPSTDNQRYKSPFARLHETAQQAITGRESPSARSQNSNTPRAKSASYHIQRATERGTSVSTAATSPLSGDQQSLQNEPQSSTNRTASNSFSNKFNGKGSRSPNEDSIYENIESDSEGSAIIAKKTKAGLKIKSSPHNGLPGLEWSSKFNTPPNGTRRNSRPRDQPSELPLTPSSKEREEKARLRKEADDAREVRKAAAEAAEQRQRKADEAQQEEAERLRRQEEDRNAREKKAAVIAKAARLEKERLERLEKEKQLEEERNAEQSRLEQARLKKETEQVARLEREKAAKLEKERQEAERIERENSKAAEAARLREAKKIERVQREAAEAEEAKKTERREKAEALKRNSASAEPLDHATPAKQTPIRPQSSTPLIPSGRKSIMKQVSSSQSGSSPLLTRASPSGSSNPSGDRPLINGFSKDRRVSFDLSQTPKRSETPIRPGARLPVAPKAETPRPTPKSSMPPKQTPILPPPSLSRLARERSASSTPQRQMAPQTSVKTPASNGRILPPASKVTPQVVIQVQSASPVSSSRNSVTPSGSRGSKEKSKPVEPPVVLSSDDSGSDEDIPSKINPVKLLNNTLRPQKVSPAPIIKREPELEEDAGDEDVEMESNQSSSPDPERRSPVIFNQNAPVAAPTLAPLPEPAQPLDDDSTQSGTDSPSVEEDVQGSSDDSGSGEDDAEEEEEEDAEEDEDATIQVPKSSPELPRSKPASKSSPEPTKASSQKPSQIPRSQSSQAIKATPILPSSQTNRPGIGASLQSLNEKKTTFTSSKSSSQVNGAKVAAKKLQEQDDEDSEEDSSDSETSETSDSDSDAPSAQLILQQSQSRSNKKSKSNSDTSSDDESGKESDDDGGMNSARNELAAHIEKAKLLNGDSQSSTKSHKSQSSSNRSARGPNRKFHSQSSSQSRKAGKELKRKTSDKYLTGYSFSQPQL